MYESYNKDVKSCMKLHLLNTCVTTES